MNLWVYAIVAPPVPRIAATGLVGERLRAIRMGRIAAIAGEVPRPPKPTVKNLRRYAAVIDAIAQRASAIIPARFGTSMIDVDELTFVLRSRQDTLRRRLRAVRGRVQMTLRLVLESESGDAALRSQSQVTSRSRVRVPYAATQGTQYLHERAAVAARAREIPGFEPIRDAVKRWVKDERVEKRAGVATVNHLIPRASAVAYRGAAERAAQRADVRLNVTGPYPPYAFAESR